MGGRLWLFQVLRKLTDSCLHRTTQQTLKANEISCLFSHSCKRFNLNPTIRVLETPGGEEFQHVTTKPAIYNILFKRLVWVFSIQSWNEPLIEEEFLYDKGCSVMQPRANASKLQSPDEHLILFVGALLQPLFCHDGSTNEVSATFQYLSFQLHGF